MPVERLLGLSITVADLAAPAAFFRDRLGLSVDRSEAALEVDWARLFGLAAGTTARTAAVAVGDQTIELVAFDPPGRPYPDQRASNDEWFEHVALVCRDIDMIAARLLGHAGVITEGGPVLLPPNTGRVSAFKFRDPEGHPLELIVFPDGVGAPVWHQKTGTGILGYDHTAIAVTDLARSLDFYVGLLGFTVGGRTLNRGPEQDRLDGLAGCEVDVVALEPALAATPHVELLHYRSPAGRPAAPICANDVASVRQVYQVSDLDALVLRLTEAGARFVSRGDGVLSDGGRIVCVADPDGHLLLLVEILLVE